MIEEICEKAKTLRLKTIADQLPPIVETAENNNWPFPKTIAHLFDLEIETRRQNRIALCYRQSKLNEKLTVDQFDFNHHSSRKKQKTRMRDESVGKGRRCLFSDTGALADGQRTSRCPGCRTALFLPKSKVRVDTKRKLPSRRKP